MGTDVEMADELRCGEEVGRGGVEEVRVYACVPTGVWADLGDVKSFVRQEHRTDASGDVQDARECTYMDGVQQSQRCGVRLLVPF